MEKARAREIIRKRLGAIDNQERARKSRQAARHLLALPEIEEAEVVLAYASLPDEVDTVPVMTRLLTQAKRVLLPRVCATGLELIEVSSLTHDVSIGAYGILEPVSGETVSVAEVDFAIIPGRAFGLRGERIGRGKGYYDRLMSREDFGAHRCGYCFACQILDDIPMDEQDIPVETIVTGKGVHRIAQTP